MDGGAGGRRGHKLVILTVYDKVGVCTYKKVGLDGLGRGGMGLGEGVKKGYSRERGHRLINDVC